MKTKLLVDDHKVVRDGLKFYFEDNAAYSIKGKAGNGEEALLFLKNDSFDLVITDLSMPKMDGIKLMEEIKTAFPQQKVLALTMLGETAHIKKMIELGVNGYLLKSSGQDEILQAIETIFKGENYFSSEVTNAIISELAGKKVQPSHSLLIDTELSRREKEVLALIVEEMSNKEIADKLFISQRTVDAHKRNLLQKTGSKNIAGLVVYAVENGLVDVNLR